MAIWKKISKDEDRNYLLFFRMEFDSNSFLAHVHVHVHVHKHTSTLEWDSGIEGLEATTKQNVEN